jgi:hypothetical protein
MMGVGNIHSRHGFFFFFLGVQSGICGFVLFCFV